MTHDMMPTYQLTETESMRMLRLAGSGNIAALDFYGRVLASRSGSKISWVYLQTIAVDPENRTVLHTAAETGQTGTLYGVINYRLVINTDRKYSS